MATISKIPVTLSFLLIAAASYAADPAAAIRRALEDDKVQASSARWSLPYAFDARTHPRGGYASVGEYYADYHGRKMQMREFIAGVGVTDTFNIWFGSQAFVAKGRSQGNRLHVSDDVYGMRWVLKPAEEAGDPSVAIEFQATRPSTAEAVTKNASATFNATKNNFYALDYGLANGLQTQFSYTSVKGAAVGNADVFGFSAARDLALKPNLTLRLQGSLVAQTYTDVVQHVDLELKPVIYAALGYETRGGIRLEGDATLLPFGIPLGGTHFQALSSFEIYRPGGIADELRNNLVGFASIRLVYHKSF